MRSPEGTVRTKRGVYREVVPPERLVFTYAWEDADGNPGHEMHVTVTFEPQGEQTLLTLHQTGFEDVPERDSHRDGWTSCFERFAEFMMAMATSDGTLPAAIGGAIAAGPPTLDGNAATPPGVIDADGESAIISNRRRTPPCTTRSSPTMSGSSRASSFWPRKKPSPACATS